MQRGIHFLFSHDKLKIMSSAKSLNVRIFETVDYRSALELQKRLVQKRKNEEIPDTLLLLEHTPVITLGKRGNDTDILLPRKKLESMGVDVVDIDRGGQVTYHGPGQLIGYFICNLYQHQRKVRRFVENIEESIIRFLKTQWDIESHIDPENVGVWSGNEKIAALGISISGGITMHGFALNIATDLTHFNWIVPCGITDKGVTSVARILETRNEINSLGSMHEVKTQFIPVVKEIFGYTSVLESS